MDGSVIWRSSERVKEDQEKSAPTPESLNGAEGLEEIMEEALADLEAGDTGDAYIVLIENAASDDDE